MSYYFSTTVDGGFHETVERVTGILKEHGFGVLTTIDVSQTLKDKIDADMPPYTILGACNPDFAHQALQAEDKIGTMLPCNVVVRQTETGAVEVAAVDPIASMQAVDNPALGHIAEQVQALLKQVVEQV